MGLETMGHHLFLQWKSACPPIFLSLSMSMKANVHAWSHFLGEMCLFLVEIL